MDIVQILTNPEKTSCVHVHVSICILYTAKSFIKKFCSALTITLSVKIQQEIQLYNAVQLYIKKNEFLIYLQLKIVKKIVSYWIMSETEGSIIYCMCHVTSGHTTHFHDRSWKNLYRF
jgi:hypothetical protein